MAENSEVRIFECSYFIGRRMIVRPEQLKNTGIGYWLPPCFMTLTYIPMHIYNDFHSCKNDIFLIFPQNIDNGTSLKCFSKKKQVAQRATIAHLRANFTFSYCKSTGDDDSLGHG